MKAILLFTGLIFSYVTYSQNDTSRQSDADTSRGKAVLPTNDQVGSKADMTGKSMIKSGEGGSHSGSGAASQGRESSTIRNPEVENPNRIRSFEGASGKSGQHYTGGRDTGRSNVPPPENTRGDTITRPQ